jgi:hypothetical protein
MRKLYILIFLVGVLVMAAFPCDAMQLYLSFDEIVKKADVIFHGKVVDQVSRYGAGGKMIFTDVYFDVLELIYKSEESEPITGSNIMLTFAGGTVGERTVRVSDVQSFETGSSYLICTRMDGKTYASPIVGGNQGLFTIITDEEHGLRYPLTPGRRGISEIRNGDVVTSPPVANIRAGVIEKSPKKETSVKFYDVAPKPAAGMDPTRHQAWVSTTEKEMPEKLMTLDELIGTIHERIKERGGDK